MIFTLTPAEYARTIGMLPDVKATMLQHAAIAADRINKKIYVRVDGGFRFGARQLQLWTWAEQDAAAGDAYPTAAPGDSHHEFGDAYDLGIENGTDADYRTLADIGRQLGMSPGLDFGDKYHFQPAGRSIEMARALFAASIKKDVQVIAVGAIATWAAATWFKRSAPSRRRSVTVR